MSYMGGFPSGQRGQTVNLLQIASVVRIHLRPCRVDEVNGTVLSAYVHAFHYNTPRWCGGIGRRKGLKIPRGQPRAGSSPATSSKGTCEKHVPLFFCITIYNIKKNLSV